LAHRHVFLTRFAVPRLQPDSAESYRSREWLEGRLRLFRRFYVPSVSGLGAPAVLLCGSEVAGFVTREIADLEWARVEVQDEWHGGWRGAADEIVTRLDSDDAVHQGWLEAVERAPETARICLTKELLRLDASTGRLHRYRRDEPSPLAAFRGGLNPYEVDHKHLETLSGTHRIAGCYLLQVVHGANLKNRRPKPWRIDRRVPRERLVEFGLGDDRSSGT